MISVDVQILSDILEVLVLFSLVTFREVCFSTFVLNNFLCRYIPQDHSPAASFSAFKDSRRNSSSYDTTCGSIKIVRQDIYLTWAVCEGLPGAIAGSARIKNVISKPSSPEMSPTTDSIMGWNTGVAMQLSLDLFFCSHHVILYWESRVIHKLHRQAWQGEVTYRWKQQ